ncbi:MAG: ZIP family metal transporter [Candidatus Woesearchaeota archaeon]
MLAYVLISTFLVSLAGLSCIFVYLLKNKTLEKIIPYLIGFAAGTMLTGSFLHLIPEISDSKQSFISILVGFIAFYFLERFLHHHHCHSKPEEKSISVLVLISDVIHNFIDGLAIASSFLISIPLGISTTLMVLFHEVPQEIGNFSILLFEKYSKNKALFLVFITQLSAILGGLIGILFKNIDSIHHIIGFAAGSFIYIAASDLFPLLHQIAEKKNKFVEVSIIIGILFMIILLYFE